MIGRTASREQADRGVDDRLLVDAEAERPIVIAVPADLREPMNRRAGQLLTQLGAGIDERGAWNVRPITSIIIWFELAVP